ncbi:unnamed protein product, partial [Discosporangium mesarthrocarpum]
ERPGDEPARLNGLRPRGRGRRDVHGVGAPWAVHTLMWGSRVLRLSLPAEIRRLGTKEAAVGDKTNLKPDETGSSGHRATVAATNKQSNKQKSLWRKKRQDRKRKIDGTGTRKIHPAFAPPTPPYKAPVCMPAFLTAKHT